MFLDRNYNVVHLLICGVMSGFISTLLADRNYSELENAVSVSLGCANGVEMYTPPQDDPAVKKLEKLVCKKK